MRRGRALDLGDALGQLACMKPHRPWLVAGLCWGCASAPALDASRSTEPASPPKGALGSPDPGGETIAASSAEATSAPAPLAPAPFRRVGELPLRLYVLDDGRVVGERDRDPGATEIDGWRSNDRGARSLEPAWVSEFFLLRGNRFERIGWHFGYSLGPVVQRVVGAPDGAIDELRWWGGARTNLLEVETLVGPRSRIRSRDGWTAWAGPRTWGGTTLAITQGVISSIVSLRGPDIKLQPTPDPSCWHGLRVNPSALWSTDEELFAFGTGCEDGGFVEVWKRGQTRGRVLRYDAGAIPAELVVPLVPGGEPSWVWRGDDGKTYLAGERPQVYSGERFEPVAEAAPPPAFRSRDGRLYRAKGRWAESSGRDWGRLRWAPRLFELVDGVEREVALPAPEPSLHVFEGTLWVHTSDDQLHRLDDGSPSSASFDIEGGPVPRVSPAQRAAAVAPGGPHCWNNVVVLYTMSKVTPDDYDFPLTRKALRGQARFRGMKLAVTRDGGERFLVGMGGDFALARELAAHVEKNVAGAKPRIVCAEPQVIRELDVDLVTGELRKAN
jgi:hypothetical protein